MLKNELNHVDSNYLELMHEIYNDGSLKDDRTSVGTKSLFGKQLEFNFNEGFPILTTKKMYFKGIVHELLWFLKGETNIKYLVENNINIWNGNAYDYFKKVWEYNNHTNQQPPSKEYFLKRILENPETKLTSLDGSKYSYGDLGNVYGKQWRDWGGIDQIAEVIDKLKNNPDSRRILVNAWNVSDVKNMALPPCHLLFQFYTHELSLEDRYKFSGLPFTLMEYRQMNSDVFPNWEAMDEYIHSQLDENNVPRKGLSLMWYQRSGDLFLGGFAPSHSNVCCKAI